MSEEPKLTLADPDDIQHTLAFALQWSGRKRVRHAENLSAQIAAAHLVKSLAESGFVVMKKPPAAAPSAPGMPDRRIPLTD